MTVQTAYDIGSPVIVHVDGFFCPGKIESFVVNCRAGAQLINYHVVVTEKIRANVKGQEHYVNSSRRLILPEKVIQKNMQLFRSTKEKLPEATNSRILWEMNKEK